MTISTGSHPNHPYGSCDRCYSEEEEFFAGIEDAVSWLEDQPGSDEALAALNNGAPWREALAMYRASLSPEERSTLEGIEAMYPGEAERFDSIGGVYPPRPHDPLCGLEGALCPDCRDAAYGPPEEAPREYRVRILIEGRDSGLGTQWREAQVWIGATADEQTVEEMANEAIREAEAYAAENLGLPREQARAPEEEPVCGTCGRTVEDPGDHADQTGHWPTTPSRWIGAV